MGPVIDHPYDYLAHAVGGAIVVEITESKTVPETLAWALGVGYGKELLDKNVDHLDAISWAIGGLFYQQYKVRVERKNNSLILIKTLEF